MEAEERKNLKEKMELKDALEIKAIRDVIWRCIEAGNVFAITSPMSVEDANYHNGKRDIALALIQEVEHANSAAWIEMQNDSLEEGEE